MAKNLICSRWCQTAATPLGVVESHLAHCAQDQVDAVLQGLIDPAILPKPLKNSLKVSSASRVGLQVTHNHCFSELVT